MSNTRLSRGAAAGSRLRRIRSRFVAVAVALTVLVTGSIVGAPSDSAWAIDYPTWDDVSAVRNDEAAAKTKIAEIESLLAALSAEAERTQTEAIAKGEAWRAADQAFQEAAFKADNLQVQADEASEKASASELRAGQWAAQLARTGGGDMTANLFANAGDADNLLYGLGMSGKLSGQAYAIYEAAVLDGNTAQALTDQATIARNELETLKVAAEATFAEAQAASQAAAAAVEEQKNNEATLRQQLVVLSERRAATEADFAAGEAERKRIADEQAAAAAAAEAERRRIAEENGNSGANGSGWARPASGGITDWFGPRVSPGGIGSSYHQGLDIGAGCGQPISAAGSGTVVYAGWNGGYGNFIMIDHGGGVQTAYGHIVNGGIQVGYGQYVNAGDMIASVGTTGNSTGCHLHFELRINGQAVNPVGFMADRGISW
ncbi:MAG: peptidoglycan DD-metalloendopeptidase family protein [Rhodoglobus sp.]